MSTADGLQRLIYRGNFSLRRKKDYGDALIRTRYGGGFTETAIIGAGLRSWALTYSALTNSPITLPSGLIKSRLDYVWDFFCDSKDGGNTRFILTDAKDNKDYLCEFTDDAIEVEMVNFLLSTTGLNIEQVNVKGINTLPDGSLGDAGTGVEI
jgi:hypothetical protein